MRQPSSLLRLALLCLLCCAVPRATVAATSYATPNFVVYAPSADVARKIALAAEHYRKELATEWLGNPLPRWSQPCPIKVKLGQIGAGGATTFTFHPTANGQAEVCGWDMQIQGSLERILDSVLPHEVSHTIFACHFRRPLPRWADEGAATLVEHESERRRQVQTVKQVLRTRRRIPLAQLLTIKEYPRDMQDVLTLYAEGYTLAELLVQKGGKARYLKFLADAHQFNSWDRAIAANYEYQGVDDLEKDWQNWIVAGCPELLPEGQMLADRGRPAAGDRSQLVLRGQNPDDDPFLAAAAARPSAGGQSPAGAIDGAEASRSLPVAARTEPSADLGDDDAPAAAPRNKRPAPLVAARDRFADRSQAFADQPAPRVAAAPETTPSAVRAQAARVRLAEQTSEETERRVVMCSEAPDDPRPGVLIRRSRGR